MKKIIVLLMLTACGTNSKTEEPSQNDRANVNVSADRDEIAKQSSVDCSASPLVGNWKVRDRRNDNVIDTIKVKANCSYETFSCGIAGFIDSDPADLFGIVEIENTTLVSYDYCPNQLGRWRCAYDTRFGSPGDLQLDCQPMPSKVTK